jgi:teichuronic acid exporter
MPVASRLYTPADFAVANLFTVIAGFVTVLVTCRYEYFVQLPKHKADAWRLVRLVVILGAASGAVLTPVAWLWREEFALWSGNSALASWLVFVPAAAVAVSVSTALQGWTQRCRYFRRSAESNVLAKLGHFGSVLSGHWLLPGGGGLILAGVGSALTKIAYLGARGRLFCLLWCRRGVTKAARSQGKLAGALVVSHLFMSCTAAIPTLFISHAYGADLLGQFALAFQIVFIPSSLLGSAIGNVYYQRAAEFWAKGESCAGLWRSTARRLIMIGVPIYSAGAVLSPWLFPVIFGARWSVAGHYASILAICAFFSFATEPLGWTFAVVGEGRYLPLWHAGRLFTTVLVAFSAKLMSLGVDGFLILLVIQMTVWFLVDYYAEWRFSLRSSAKSFS